MGSGDDVESRGHRFRLSSPYLPISRLGDLYRRHRGQPSQSGHSGAVAR
jgi:hypothetical protein